MRIGNNFRSLILTAIVAISADMVMSMGLASAGEVIGWMDVRPADRQIGVTARAYALSETPIEYELQIERVGRSGKTATKQRGKAEIEPGKVAELSTTSVNIGAGDELAILLTIFSGGQVVSTNALHMGPH